MRLSPMRFGSYTWPHNPRVYEISYDRQIVSHKLPMGCYTLQNMGRKQRILRGEGEFAGRDAYDEFKKLASVFYSEKPAVLVHPVWQSAPAWFVSLRLKQEPREDYVEYEFEFWESFEGYDTGLTRVPHPNEGTGGYSERKSCVAGQGDSLWALALRNGLSLAAILELNPQIHNANVLSVGQRIYLS